MAAENPISGKLVPATRTAKRNGSDKLRRMKCWLSPSKCFQRQMSRTARTMRLHSNRGGQEAPDRKRRMELKVPAVGDARCWHDLVKAPGGKLLEIYGSRKTGEMFPLEACFSGRPAPINLHKAG